MQQENSNTKDSGFDNQYGCLLPKGRINSVNMRVLIWDHLKMHTGEKSNKCDVTSEKVGVV